MEWLLKIVEGPMNGAEIALVTGSRISVGSGEDCDIVIADQTLPAKACELDVSESAVTRIGNDGEATVLKPFVIAGFGTTAIAVGPAEGVWEELRKPSPETPAADAPDGTGATNGTPVTGAGASQGGDTAADGKSVSAAGEHENAEAKHASRRWIGGLVALLLLFLVVVLVWLFWAKIVAHCPQVKAWRASCRHDAAAETVVKPAPTLADIAATYGLALTSSSNASTPSCLLRGNLKRRTERLAIRALALAADPSVKFDLTDDESLCASANELLFVVTEGRLTASSATNRVVTLAGYAPNAAALERAVRALSADVPGIERLQTQGVQVGGVPPKAKDAPVTVFETPSSAEPVKKTVQVRSYPIAGILTKPYPCVVMRSGLRLTEGAQIENVVIEKIEVDKLTLRDGNATVVIDNL